MTAEVPSKAPDPRPELAELGRGYSAKDVAAVTTFSLRRVEYAIATGELTAYRCGRRVVVWERDLLAWLYGLPRHPGGQAGIGGAA